MVGLGWVGLDWVGLIDGLDGVGLDEIRLYWIDCLIACLLACLIDDWLVDLID